jgi:hypothetical protein
MASPALDYQLLGPVRVLGQPDSAAGYSFNPFLPNTGWDVLINASTVAQPGVCVTGQWPRQEQFEVYQVSLDGPVGSSVMVMFNRQPWNFVIQGWQNYDDVNQPWPVRKGDDIQFAWTFAATAGPYTVSGGANVQPAVTLWLRAPAGQQ